MRKIQQASPTSTVRAFADDIGMVVDDFGADAEKIMSIFDRFYLASGLQLNFPKTVAIPLGGRRVGEYPKGDRREA